MGHFCQVSTEMLNSFWCSILANYFINFLQSLNWSRFKDLGLLWDCKSFNFVKQYRVTALDLKIR